MSQGWGGKARNREKWGDGGRGRQSYKSYTLESQPQLWTWQAGTSNIEAFLTSEGNTHVPKHKGHTLLLFLPISFSKTPCWKLIPTQYYDSLPLNISISI